MVKIKLMINPANLKQVAYLNALLLEIGAGHAATSSLAAQAVQTAEAQDRFVHDMVQTQQEAEKPKRTRAPKAAPVETEEKPSGEEITLVEKLTDEDKEEPTTPETSIEKIREMLGKKVNEHRDSIKAKLTEFGAKNVSVLDSAHYDSFYQFISKL